MVDFPLVTGSWSTEYDLWYRTCINLYPCGKLDLTSLVSPFCRHDFQASSADIAPMRKALMRKHFPEVLDGGDLRTSWSGDFDSSTVCRSVPGPCWKLKTWISFSMRDGNPLGFNTPNGMMMYHQPESLVHHLSQRAWMLLSYAYYTTCLASLFDIPSHPHS